jgi:hypothetical protein
LGVEADLVLEIGWALERVFELQRQLVVMEDPVLVVDDNGELELEPELQLKPLPELQTVRVQEPVLAAGRGTNPDRLGSGSGSNLSVRFSRHVKRQ